MVAAGCEVEAITGAYTADVFVATLVSTFRLSGMVGCFGLFRICDRMSLAYSEFELKLGSLVLYRLFSRRCCRAVGGVVCCGMVCTFYDLKLAACYFRPLVVKVCSSCADATKVGVLKVGEIRGGLEGVLFKVFKLLRVRRVGALKAIGLEAVQLVCVGLQWNVSLRRGGYSVWCVCCEQCVFRDFCCLVSWFVGSGRKLSATAADSLVYLAVRYNVYVHVHDNTSSLRSGVLNERYMANSGYTRMAADSLVIWDGNGASVVGQISKLWLDSNVAAARLYVSARCKLQFEQLAKIISLFLLDYRLGIFTHLSCFEHATRYVFLNENTQSCATSLHTLRTVDIMRLGISKVKLGKLAFVCMPHWRFSLD